MNRNAVFGAGALLGAAVALVWDRRARLAASPAPLPEARQRELREKLAETQRAEVPPEPPKPPEPPEPPPPTEPPAPRPEARPVSRPTPAGPPPADEFEAMRKRIHEEGKAAAEEMRHVPDEAS